MDFSSRKICIQGKKKELKFGKVLDFSTLSLGSVDDDFYFATTTLYFVAILKFDDDVENIVTDKQYPKLSKASSGYLEIEHFKNADLHTGYFCYNCTYFIKDNHCAIVQDIGPDVNGEESGIIAPYGVCTLWDPNEEEAR